MLRATLVLCVVLGSACGSSEEPRAGGDGGDPVSAGAAGGAAGGAVGGGGAAGGTSDASTSTAIDAGSGVAGGTSGGGAITGAGGTAGAGGTTGAGSEAGVAAPADGGSAAALDKFSFFVTSLASLRKLSKSQNGFGGDLRFGETGDGAGLRGADKICATIAELSMPGSAAKQWRAFLSTSKENAKDRIGSGPWYDRQGRLVAENLMGLIQFRPAAHEIIADNLPNEFGVPNHDPDGTGAVDNHDTLTGSNALGNLYCPEDPGRCTCNDWTSSAKDNTKPPRVGHSWPRFGAGDIGGILGGLFGGGGPPGGGGVPGSPGDPTGGGYGHWISSLDEAGCGAGINLAEVDSSGNPGPNAQNPVVGSGGGYGAWYCFALTP